MRRSELDSTSPPTGLTFGHLPSPCCVARSLLHCLRPLIHPGSHRCQFPTTGSVPCPEVAARNRQYPCATVGEQRESSAMFAQVCHLFNAPDWLSHCSLLINMQRPPRPAPPSPCPKTKAYCASTSCFNYAQRGRRARVFCVCVRVCVRAHSSSCVHVVCVHEEEELRCHREGRSRHCPTGEREREGCCLLPLCKLASDKGFYRRATKRACDRSAGQNGRGEEGLWGKDRDKLPISVPTAIMFHSSFLLLFPLPSFHPSLPHAHDPVINLLEISRSLINACPPSFPLAFSFFFDCIGFWVFSLPPPPILLSVASVSVFLADENEVMCWVRG